MPIKFSLEERVPVFSFRKQKLSRNKEIDLRIIAPSLELQISGTIHCPIVETSSLDWNELIGIYSIFNPRELNLSPDAVIDGFKGYSYKHSYQIERIGIDEGARLVRIMLKDFKIKESLFYALKKLFGYRDPYSLTEYLEHPNLGSVNKPRVGITYNL
ncbi:MAG: hypothetical protein Q8N99_03400 [Nanoarchaeota archaeon]|nr:hypothetical protein [Nanoarchaeota archaeon]